MSEPELVWDLGAELGEGPVWDADRACVWFVDIKGRQLHCFDVGSGEKQSWTAPDQIGFALPARDGCLICGVRGGIHRFDPKTGSFALIVAIEPDQPGNRLNDGFAAPDGSLWFGTMDDAEQSASGALYRLTAEGLTKHDEGYIVTNGPALSPDGGTLYHNDTMDRAVYAFDHAGGALSNKRLFARTTDGFADGLAVDVAGVVHVGLFNGWGVARFSPQGEHLGTIRLPVQSVTKAAFGGDDLRDLYCTTAWAFNADKRDAQPTLGGLYRVRVDQPGLAPHRVAL